MKPRAVGRAVLGVLLVLATGCSYAPDFESGTLACSSEGTCPEGYTCADGLTCWRSGECPTSATPAARFVGQWDFVSPSTRSIVCDGTAMPIEDVAGDYAYVEEGGPAPLRTTYFCDWDLDLDPTGTTTVIRAGESCSGPDLDNPDIVYTWTGQAFTLSTSNGRTGTLQMSLPYTYTSPAGNGSCTMTYTVTLTRTCS